MEWKWTLNVLDDTVHTLKSNLLEKINRGKLDFLTFSLCISLHPCLSEFFFLFTFQSHSPLLFSHVIVFIPFLPKLSFSLILSLSARIFLCPSSPTLESESSPLPSAHLSRHFRPGMAPRSTTPPPLHVSQSDTAMLRKSVSFSEELLLVASGRTHPLLSQ